MVSRWILILVAWVGYGEFCVLANEVKIEKTYIPDSCPRKSKNGDKLTMHYTGFIDESSITGTWGKEFDSSVKKNKPFSFTLGQGQVIKGWDQGLIDMCVGEKRVLVIPPELGYGDKGAGRTIPGGATLKFEVECVDISDDYSGTRKTGEQPNIFKEIDKDEDWLITYDELMEFHIKRFGSSRLPPPGMWERIDKNKDGIITWEEFDGPKGSEGPPSSTAKKDL